jgi:hypothetical protein
MLYGQGLSLTPAERDEFNRLDPRNHDVILPYMGGQELNSNPRQAQ